MRCAFGSAKTIKGNAQLFGELDGYPVLLRLVVWNVRLELEFGFVPHVLSN